ncbi:Tad domain-containing protein [Methylorubrum extorquens]
MIFALALLPMAFLAGMTIDYAQNTNLRHQAQVAVDATALALAKLPLDTTDKDLAAKAEAQVLTALKGLPIDALTVTMRHNGDLIEVAAKGATPTSLTRLAGFMSMPLDVSATSNRSMTDLEIALVLDNTGSMKGTKLTNLKAAARDLVTNLFKQADPAKPNALKIGIVPFSMTVNVGPGFAGSDWLDINAKSPIHQQIFNAQGVPANRFSLFADMGKPWAGCVESRPAPYDVQDTAPSQANPVTLFVPFFAPDESDNDGSAVNDYMADLPSGGSAGGASNRQLQGMTAKYERNAFKVSATARNSMDYLYGPNAGCEIRPLTRLTTSQSQLTNAITAMTAIGETNIPTGLAWGWHLLSPNAPFKDGVAYGETKTKKFIVLMTDGQNQSTDPRSDNRSYYSGLGFIWQNRIGTTSNDTAVRRRAIDARLSLLCDNIRKARIQVFAVRVEVNDSDSAVLKACASSPNMFFEVKNSSGLPAVFRAIADQISELRISQ